MSRISSNNNDSYNIHNSFNVTTTNNYPVIDDKSKILDWLSPLEPLMKHEDIETQRVRGVGDWLLRTKEFTRWYSGCGSGGSDPAILFCYGGPGVGKSHLTSLVIDTLCTRRSGKNTAVTCFYFDFTAREKQSPKNMLGSLLKQLLDGLEEFPKEIVQEFRDQKKNLGGRGLQPPEIVHLFQSISSNQHTFICIDAIDECEEAHRLEVLSSLRRLLRTSSNTRIFMTGRPHVRAKIEGSLGFTVTSVSIIPTQDDITTYLQDILGKDEMPEEMNSKLEAEILKSIPEMNPEIFLLVSLQIKAILLETTISRRRKRLKEMANGLGLEDAYCASLKRINAQGEEKAKLATATLMWLCHSERPLKVDELRHVLAVEIGSTDFDPENIPSKDTLVACCQGLIAVDRKADTVRLVHSTLREYLSDHPDLFPKPHSTMSEACLTYLSSRQVKGLSPKSISKPQSKPFLEYSSRYWGTHAKKELSNNGKRLALELLGQYENHITAESLFQQVEHQNHSSDIVTPSLFTALHCACFFGIDEVVKALIERKGYDINQTDRVGATPLTWAARNGHEGVVKLLLRQKDVIPDKADNRGTTPFSYAAGQGHDGVVKLLLRRKDVAPDTPDNKGRTPFSHAAGWGNEGVAKLLLKRKDIAPDTPDNNGTTPFSFAAGRGHEEVVKLLLRRKDIIPDKRDNKGRTPFSYAASWGHERVVKLLLKRKDITPDSPDDEDGTPLSYAAGRGHEEVVKLLLGREDVHPERRDNKGRTPLSYAANWGHEGVVELLLGQKDVIPDGPDNEGRTPLLCSACNGREGVVKLLLRRKDVTPDRPDNKGTTPLSFAARMGHEGVLELLLEREDVHPDTPDDRGTTPLSHAASRGHERVVKLLLRRKDITPDSPDEKDGTPLSYASGRGHEEVVKLLLGREDVHPDRRDNGGRTPLSYAANWGHEGVVELLLEREDVHPDTPDDRGTTPFSYAARRGHEGVVKLLLGREDVRPDRPDKIGRTPFSHAASWGHEGVVKLLLKSQYVIPGMPDNKGRTPLSYAEMNGRSGIVQLLQTQNPTTGRTALLPASLPYH